MFRSSRRTLLGRFARTLAVAWLCLATPALQDIVLDAVSWATGVEVCVDGCDETEGSCTQQCGHCLCSAHAGLLPDGKTSLLAAQGTLFQLPASHAVTAHSGHLDPPFRPPVS